MAVALRASGRPILYSLCNWGRRDEDEGATWEWAAAFAQQWRTTTDIFPSYARVYAIIEENAPLSPYARPGASNDPDMLEVGVNGSLLNVPGFPAAALSPDEASLHFSMWCMLSAPLLIGADVRTAPEWVVDILRNPEVIAIDQDELGRQAVRVRTSEEGTFVPLPLVPSDFWGAARLCFGRCRKLAVWVKPLSSGAAAVALLNLGDQFSARRAAFAAEAVGVSGRELELYGELDLAARAHCVRDVLRQQDAEHVPAGTDPSRFYLQRADLAPRSHALLVIRPCSMNSCVQPGEEQPELQRPPNHGDRSRRAHTEMAACREHG